MIPLSVPNISGNEAKYVLECLETGWISTAGEYGERFETDFAAAIGSKNTVSTMNGTAALHIALVTAGVAEDHVVVVPNITFVATANAVKYVGAEPVLIDIDPYSWQMDLDLLETMLVEDCQRDTHGILKHRPSGKTLSTVVIVHVQGHMCDMDRLLDICRRFDLHLVEDAAEALGSTYDGKMSGTFGLLGCFSFNGNKIMSTGGGGMVVARHKYLADRIRHLVTTAKTDPLNYYHDQVGYNYRMVNILAAIGVAQLENLRSFLDSKRRTAAFYENELRDLGVIQFQKSGSRVNPNHWLFTFRTNEPTDLLGYLNSNGIMSRPFWTPMDKLPMFSSCSYVTKDNVSERIQSSAISIPCSTNITMEQLYTVAKRIKKYFGA